MSASLQQPPQSLNLPALWSLNLPALCFCCALGLFQLPPALAAPPFSGTIFIDRDIITEADPTAYQTLEDKGRGLRTMFDRRVNNWVTLNAFLFEARFDDGLKIEAQVNPEYETAAAARAEALRYMHSVGQLPTALRADVQTIWIHQGLQPFGGGNNNLLIHSGQADAYLRDGILEETFMHEASHTSLDARHASAPGWLAAQKADPEFISTYARDFPLREDVAETFVPYFAVQYRRDRISPAMAETILGAIPHRIAYLNAQALDLHPVTASPITFTNVQYDPISGNLILTWSSRPNHAYALEISADLKDWQDLEINLPATGLSATFEVSRESLLTPRFFRVRQITPLR